MAEHLAFAVQHENRVAARATFLSAEPATKACFEWRKKAQRFVSAAVRSCPRFTASQTGLCLARRGVVGTLLISVLPLFAAAKQSSWAATTPLPDGYTAHAVAGGAGHLYLVGGINLLEGVQGAHRVLVSAVQPGGGLGPWIETTPLPEGVYFHAAVATSGFLYVLGGFHYNGSIVLSDAVYVSKIQPNGDVGPWNATSPLPQANYFFSATAWNGTLYVTGGSDGASLYDAVLAADVGVGGLLGPWRAEPPLPQGVYTHASTCDGTLYVIGGGVNGGNSIHSAVYSSVVNPNGTLQAWTVSTALPQPLSNHVAVSGFGRVITVGGWEGSTPTDMVTQANSSVQGLGSWSPGASLPQSLYLHAGAVVGGRVYVAGGSTSSATQSGVHWLQIPGATVSYCTAGTTTNGCNALMTAMGIPSVSAPSGFVVTCSSVEGDKSGLIFYGVSGRHATAWAPGSTSFLCVKSPVQRMLSQNSGGTGGSCDGSFSIDWSAWRSDHAAALGQPFAPGHVVDAQAWYRDPSAPGTTNLSDALEFTLSP